PCHPRMPKTWQEGPLKRASRQILPLIGFLLVTALMYPGIWLGRSDLYSNDLTELNLPQRQVAARIWRDGEVPLWNRFAFGGQPLLAAGQAGVLYPPNALSLFLPAPAAMNWCTLLHLALAGYLMFLFLLQLWPRAVPAWIGGVIYMTSGFFAGHV